MQKKDDRTFARHWEDLVTLASNESDSQKRALLAQELLQLLEHESKPKRGRCRLIRRRVIV